MTLENSTFIEALSQQGWDIQVNNTEDLNNLTNEKLKNAPEVFKSFIRSFENCANKEDNIWFLSHKDYNDETDSAFPWDEFEQQSLQAAEITLIADIKKFWESHLPILMSVKTRYQYIAIGVGKENADKIYYGSEPEYEEAILIANSFSEFKEHYINALNGTFQSDYYKFVV